MGTAVPFPNYKTSVLQHFQVFGCRWLRNIKRGAQFARSFETLFRQHCDHTAPCAVGKGMKSPVQCRIFFYNHLVI